MLNLKYGAYAHVPSCSVSKDFNLVPPSLLRFNTQYRVRVYLIDTSCENEMMQRFSYLLWRLTNFWNYLLVGNDCLINVMVLVLMFTYVVSLLFNPVCLYVGRKITCRQEVNYIIETRNDKDAE